MDQISFTFLQNTLSNLITEGDKHIQFVITTERHDKQEK